ncbi:hypothetical protein B0H10DRAFT_1965035 [Mycena sp. CBHHK59/15]|nr:hypothetical protein B0H10DRAFT_1965035 [Mycena sp. CBHHK59/15]
MIRTLSSSRILRHHIKEPGSQRMLGPDDAQYKFESVLDWFKRNCAAAKKKNEGTAPTLSAQSEIQGPLHNPDEYSAIPIALELCDRATNPVQRDGRRPRERRRAHEVVQGVVQEL